MFRDWTWLNHTEPSGGWFILWYICSILQYSAVFSFFDPRWCPCFWFYRHIQFRYVWNRLEMFRDWTWLNHTEPSGVWFILWYICSILQYSAVFSFFDPRGCPCFWFYRHIQFRYVWNRLEMFRDWTWLNHTEPSGVWFILWYICSILQYFLFLIQEGFRVFWFYRHIQFRYVWNRLEMFRDWTWLNHTEPRDLIYFIIFYNINEPTLDIPGCYLAKELAGKLATVPWALKGFVILNLCVALCTASRLSLGMCEGLLRCVRKYLEYIYMIRWDSMYFGFVYSRFLRP